MNTEDPPPCDVLCVGLLCADLILTVETHPGPDEKIRASDHLLTPGGPAAVAAAQVAQLNGRAAFAGLIGDDTLAHLLRSQMQSAGIDDSGLLSVPKYPTPLAAILVKPDGTRTVVSHRAPPDQPSPAPHFAPARVLLTDGHRPEWIADLVGFAHDTGATLVLDAGSVSEGVLQLARHADHVVASEICARNLLNGQDPAEPGALERLQKKLHLRPPAELVVTLGARGAVWFSPKGQGSIRAYDVSPVLDTTGAGDAFHGAYALSLARRLTEPERMAFASAAGALACTRRGAWSSVPNQTEVETLLRSQTTTLKTKPAP